MPFLFKLNIDNAQERKEKHLLFIVLHQVLWSIVRGRFLSGNHIPGTCWSAIDAKVHSASIFLSCSFVIGLLTNVILLSGLSLYEFRTNILVFHLNRALNVLFTHDRKRKKLLGNSHRDGMAIRSSKRKPASVVQPVAHSRTNLSMGE